MFLCWQAILLTCETIKSQSISVSNQSLAEDITNNSSLTYTSSNTGIATISGTTVTFVAPEEYASYSWYIDGVLQDNEHTQSFILDTTNLSARSYYIMLVVVDEKDAVYSAQYELEVTK